MPVRAVLRAVIATATVVLLASLAACGGSAPSSKQGGSRFISSARCAQNQAAGTVTYLTGYHYQASASILEVLAAEKLGYYGDLCLTVKVQPGNGVTSQAGQLLASGRVQLAGIAEQDLIQLRLAGSDIEGISSYSNSGLDIVMTEPSVTNLKQINGETLGYKGYMPLALEAMLDKEGVDFASLKKVTVGYDPTVLPRGQVQALTGFISNEPLLLKADGDKVRIWDPATYGIASSLGSYAVNPAFAQAHPTAVEDFLRATFHAFQYCSQTAHVDQCISIEHGYAGPTDDAAHEKQVWLTESGVAAKAPVPTGFGTVDMKNVAQLAPMVTQYAKTPVSASQAQSYFTNKYVDAISKDGRIVWPAR